MIEFRPLVPRSRGGDLGCLIRFHGWILWQGRRFPVSERPRANFHSAPPTGVHSGSGTRIGLRQFLKGQGISVPNWSGVAESLRWQWGQMNFSLFVGSLMSSGAGTMNCFEHSGQSKTRWKSSLPAERRAEQCGHSKRSGMVGRRRRFGNSD